MAKFCGKCGTKLDETTSLCPNCDAEITRKQVEQSVVQPEEIEKEAETVQQQDLPLSKKETRKIRKVEKKAAKKAKKEEKRAGWSTGKKIRRFFLKCILVILLFVVLFTGVVGSLVYFDVLNIPAISCILTKSGLEKKEIVSTNPMTDNYIPEADSIAIDKKTGLYYANNEIIVIFSENATDKQKEDVISYVNGEHVGTVPELNMYQIKLQNGRTLEYLSSVSEEIMSKFDFVTYATYDLATVNPESAYVPNDPWGGDVANDDWNNDTIDKEISNYWIKAINAQNAWDYNDKFSEIAIGIIDTSFDVGHEDLKNKVSFPNKLLESRNDESAWWSHFENWKHFKTWNILQQKNCHGTHVAGIIGAEGDNKKGITGIVQNCKLLLAPAYQRKNDKFICESTLYASLACLVKADAKVVNSQTSPNNI